LASTEQVTVELSMSAVASSTPPTRSMASEICSAPRVRVPLRSIAAVKSATPWERPFCSS
jgi:hypothetical protein